MNEIDVLIENYGASAMGWVRRTDLGPDVWEMPDGRLHKVHPGEYPVLAKWAGPIPNRRAQ